MFKLSFVMNEHLWSAKQFDSTFCMFLYFASYLISKYFFKAVAKHIINFLLLFVILNNTI
jgi:hypothetical protein